MNGVVIQLHINGFLHSAEKPFANPSLQCHAMGTHHNLQTPITLVLQLIGKQRKHHVRDNPTPNKMPVVEPPLSPPIFKYGGL